MADGKWDDKLFGCGCYAAQRLVMGKWETRFTVCERHGEDEAFRFVLHLLIDPHKARLEMLRQRYEYDHPVGISARQPEI